MEKKVYNLKQSSLGKVTFLNGTCFIAISFNADNGEKVKEVIIVPSIEEGIKRFPKFVQDLGNKHITDTESFHDGITNYLINNCYEQGIKSFQKEMAEKYGFDDFLKQDPVEWIKGEPEMVPLTLVHVASRFANGHLALPAENKNLEITVKFVKNVLAVNFWEDGNPKSSEPIK